MHIGYCNNEFGTLVSRHRCDKCGTEFVVCPAVYPDDLQWNCCLATVCDSYDPTRDADKLFHEDPDSIRRKPYKPRGVA